MLLTETWWHHRRYANRRHLYRPAIAEYMEGAAGFTDAHAYLDAQSRRAALTAAWERWFAEHDIDFVLEPTLPILPYQRGRGYDRSSRRRSTSRRTGLRSRSSRPHRDLHFG